MPIDLASPHCYDPAMASHCQNGQASPAALSDEAQLVIRKALSAVARMQGRYGRQRVADVLHGSRTPAIQRDRLDELSTFGLLPHLPRDWIVDLLERMESAGLIASSGTRPVLSLLPAGREVMLDRERARLVLPELPLTPREQVRFERLQQLRLEWARQAGLSLFMVIPNRTLRAIARACPANRTALGKIDGMGPRRLDLYAEAILAAVGFSAGDDGARCRCEA